MRLLERYLPRLSLRPAIEATAFFDRCERVVSDTGVRIDRRRDFSGPGFDQLNLWLREQSDDLMLRMISTPGEPRVVKCDVIACWQGQPSYDEYVQVAKSAYGRLLRRYSSTFGGRLRLGISRKAAIWDWDRSTVNCNQLRYAHQKFREAVRALAIGAQDSRGRLKSAYWILDVIRPEELPEPLQPHLEWIFRQLSWRAPRWKGDGSVDATLAGMKRQTGARIAERIVEIWEALDELCPTNRL